MWFVQSNSRNLQSHVAFMIENNNLWMKWNLLGHVIFLHNISSLSLQSSIPLAILNPFITMDFISNLYHLSILWLCFVGGGPLDKKKSFHPLYQNNNWWKNNQVICWSCFFIIMASLKILFLIMHSNSHLSCGKGFLSF